MARQARVVVPGVPHHVVQQGNRRQATFFDDADYQRYRGLVAAACGAHGVECWAYCLMPNHVHLVLVPPTAPALAAALGEAHRRYSSEVNAQQGWTGFLWQGRFASCALDRRHLIAAARYVELNPVRAGLVEAPQAWRWSSAGPHLASRDDTLVRVRPLLKAVPDRAGLLGEVGPDPLDILRRHTRTGRALGDDAFLDAVEAKLGRSVRPARPGRKPKTPAAAIAE